MSRRFISVSPLRDLLTLIETKKSHQSPCANDRLPERIQSLQGETLTAGGDLQVPVIEVDRDLETALSQRRQAGTFDGHQSQVADVAAEDPGERPRHDGPHSG